LTDWLSCFNELILIRNVQPAPRAGARFAENAEIGVPLMFCRLVKAQTAAGAAGDRLLP
jgi:hypothetical protein